MSEKELKAKEGGGAAAAAEEENGDEVIEEETLELDPLLKLSELRFALTLPSDLYSDAEKKQTFEQVMTIVKDKNMTPMYVHICTTSGIAQDAELVKKMKEANEKEQQELDAKLEDAKKNHGDIEILEAKMNTAHFLARIGEKAAAFKAYEECLEKTVGSGKRIDVVFTLIRLALAWSDQELVKKHLAKCTTLVEKEGDWERRNRLCVYRAMNHILLREYIPASKLLLDSIATFTCTELFSYERFIFYAVVAAIVGVDRVTLRDQVLKSPDVLQVLDETPNLRSFLTSFHKCDYAQFFRALSKITDLIKKDKYFSLHVPYYLKEVRVKAYKQFLQSYKSVTLQSMATSFGVSVDFLDKELSRFIAANRIVAKIDRVSNIVETSLADSRNELYLDVLKQGDMLLNRVQKLNQKIRTA